MLILSIGHKMYNQFSYLRVISLRYACDDAFCNEVRPTQCCHDRQNYTTPTACTSGGSASDYTAGGLSTENDYLLTTRSCADSEITNDKTLSHIPLMHHTDETIVWHNTTRHVTVNWHCVTVVTLSTIYDMFKLTGNQTKILLIIHERDIYLHWSVITMLQGCIYCLRT